MIAFLNLGVISMISVVTSTIAKILVDVFEDFNAISAITCDTIVFLVASRNW